MELTIWSVGHSILSLEGLVDVLAPYEVERVADVRRFPGSRRHPHFGEEQLRAGLAAHGIGYAWLPELGGRRAAVKDGAGSGWRHPAFRAYAAHIETAEFAAGLQKLLELSQRQRTTMMCSEVLWWRCHRRIISDVLVTRGVEVIHILSAEKSQPHVLRPPARLVDGRLAYPPG